MAVAKSVKLGWSDEGVLRSADFSQVIIPGIGDASVGDKASGVRRGFVLGAGYAITERTRHPSRRKYIGEFGGHHIQKLVRVVQRVDVAGELMSGWRARDGTRTKN